MNFAEVKSILESLTALVKKAATLDLQEKIVSLREYIVSLKDENISLKEENQTLKLHLSAGQDFILKDGIYWKDGDKTPFCQPCMDGSKKPIHLQILGNGWKCFVCDKYVDPQNGASRARTVYPRRMDSI